MRLITILLFLLVAVVGRGAAADTPVVLLDDEPRTEFLALTQYEAKVLAARSAQPPVLNLLPLSAPAQVALRLALQQPELIALTRDPQTKEPYRLEVFAVRPLRAGDLGRDSAECPAKSCWTIDIYNTTQHSSIIMVVNTVQKKQVSIRNLPNFQPEIPKHLEELAIEIASRSPAVRRHLPHASEKPPFVMAGTKTALHRTRCERSQRLCVAPTFVMPRNALWTIVDLEEARVVGLTSTTWRDTAPVAFTEQRLRDEVIFEELCRTTKKLERDGWSFRYQLTSSDGLELLDASYRGQPRIKSAKNVDWHVSYSDGKGFGYSDAVGCPLFSAAAVVPASLPKVKELTEDGKPVGFEFHTDFMSKLWPMPCNYYYEQRFQFFLDGRFRVAVASVGRGCGEPGIYRPVVRIELPISSPSFASWTGKDWRTWTHEGWELQSAQTPYTSDGYQYRIMDASGHGYYIAPGRGQFADKGRGDNAYLYVVRDHPEKNEGHQDLPTIGPCCNATHEQGPDRFINSPPESLGAAPIVLWYVPQLTNDGSPGNEYCWGNTAIEKGKVVKYEYPCIAGPLFVPFGPTP